MPNKNKLSPLDVTHVLTTSIISTTYTAPHRKQNQNMSDSSVPFAQYLAIGGHSHFRIECESYTFRADKSVLWRASPVFGAFFLSSSKRRTSAESGSDGLKGVSLFLADQACLVTGVLLWVHAGEYTLQPQSAYMLGAAVKETMNPTYRPVRTKKGICQYGLAVQLDHLASSTLSTSSNPWPTCT